MSAADLVAAMRERHVPQESRIHWIGDADFNAGERGRYLWTVRICGEDHERWPCEVARLLRA